MSAALSLVAFFALCAGLAAAWIPGGCIPALDTLQTCAGTLTGAALGAACCPQLQSVYQNCGGQGMETILGESDDMSYWQTLINAMEAEGCFGKGPSLAPLRFFFAAPPFGVHLPLHVALSRVLSRVIHTIGNIRTPTPTAPKYTRALSRQSACDPHTRALQHTVSHTLIHTLTHIHLHGPSQVHRANTQSQLNTHAHTSTSTRNDNNNTRTHSSAHAHLPTLPQRPWVGSGRAQEASRELLAACWRLLTHTRC